MRNETPFRPRAGVRVLTPSLVRLFEESQRLAADVLTAANASSAAAYASAAQRMAHQAARERVRIGASAVRFAYRQGR